MQPSASATSLSELGEAEGGGAAGGEAAAVLRRRMALLKASRDKLIEALDGQVRPLCAVLLVKMEIARRGAGRRRAEPASGLRPHGCNFSSALCSGPLQAAEVERLAIENAALAEVR